MGFDERAAWTDDGDRAILPEVERPAPFMDQPMMVLAQQHHIGQ